VSVAAPAAARHAVVHRLAVSRIDRMTDDAITITFDVPDELREEYAFAHGQHVAIAVPGASDSLRRSYSICPPAGSGELRVAVKLIPGGEFSPYAHSTLRPGDELEVLTPSGRFRTELDPTQEKHYAAIAAGSGITPIISILATTLAVEPKSTFTLLYGNRTTASTMFLEELLDLKNRYTDRLALYTVLSREAQDVPLLAGRIDGAKLMMFLGSALGGREFDEWFLCGPLEMVESLRNTLVERGADAHRIHRELFHVGPAATTGRPTTLAQSGAHSTVTIVLDGRSTQFELDANGPTILDAALAARPDAPYACKGGVCGTCRCRVTEGEVEMTGGYALESDELDAGFVLACQSHPLTPTVTLDFDA
jgi:ring-1,2-phenylacetyl-CoA epoxidase subunit PaaE